MLARISVRNPVAINLLMLLIIAGGLYKGFEINREFFPETEPDRLVISTIYPGAPPEEVEKGITRKVEEAISDLDNLDEVEATVLEGRSAVIITLKEGADVNRVLLEVKQRVDTITDFPDEAEEPDVDDVLRNIPVISVVVYGDVPERRLRDKVQEIEDRLLLEKAISRVVITGSRAPEISVEIRPGALDQYGLSFQDVARAVAQANLDLPGGQLKTPTGNTRIRTLGEVEVTRFLEQIVVAADPGGGVVFLRDLADVRDTFEDQTNRGRFAGQRAMSVVVFKSKGEDAIEIARIVKGLVAEERRTLDGTGLHIDTNTDLARFIEQRLALMTKNALTGLVLVFLALTVFLRFGVAFWAASGLVVSFLGGFILMDFFGATFNLISMFGLIVVLGLIVDDAIVIGENVYRRMEEGEEPEEAAVNGTNEVAMPVFCAILTTMAAFLPLAFIDGTIGDYMGVIPVVVIAALSVSMLEAFCILPSHLAEFVRVRKRDEGESGARRSLWVRWGDTVQGCRERWLMGPIQAVYRRTLRLALEWRYVTIAVFVGSLIVVSSFVAGGILPFVLIQETDAETLICDVEMAAGTTATATEEVIARIETVAQEISESSQVFSTVGLIIDADGRLADGDPETLGQITVELKPAEDRDRSSQEIQAEWRERVGTVPGATKVAFGARSGGPQGADIVLEVRGEDLERLQLGVEHVKELLAEYQGVGDIEDNLQLGKLEIRLELLPSARALGLTTLDLAQQMRAAVFGQEAQRVQRGPDEVRVYVRLTEAQRDRIADLEQIRISTPTGARVPLGEVARIHTGRGYASLFRVDQLRAARVKADVDDRLGNVNDINNELAAELESFETLFPGTTVAFKGRKKETTDSLGSLKVGFPVVLALVYAIIAILFRSYVQPILIMSILPFALVGAFVGHLIMGFPLTLLSLIGLVALVGIVVNDSLILVNAVNVQRSRGVPTSLAVVEAGRLRLRPILLTSVTTILGLTPLMLEKSFQAQFLIPLAISIVFGLAFATLLVLVMIPCLYVILEDVQRFARWLWTGEWREEASRSREVTTFADV